MKKRFLPFSLVLGIMILGQSAQADNGGQYVPRVKGTATAESMMRDMRVNQATGLIDPALMIAASKDAGTIAKDNTPIYWVEMGPDNMGGKTTSIVYNNANMNEVYIGSMGGGVFYTWNQGISWHQVGENLMVSCMVQDTDGTIYVGTGDGANAVSYNGLADASYENSFIGSGLYTIKNNVMSRVESTIPTSINGVTEWSFINDLAIVGNKLIAATETGLRYSSDKGATWQYAQSEGADITGSAFQVRITADNKVVASVDGKLYMGALDAMTCYSAASEVTNEEGAITAIANAAALLDVAVAPSDANTIYAATINADGQHAKIYCSNDQGATWRVILPTVAATWGHQVYEGYGLTNHGIVVDPANADRIYVLGYNLWRLDRPVSDPNGYFMTTLQSDGGAASIYSDAYLHVGLHAMAFDPRNSKKAYIATDGGIYKSTEVSTSDYLSYTNCNRGYNTVRCFNVGISGKGTRVMGGTLDHGPIMINGEEGTNTPGYAIPLLPTASASTSGVYEESYHGGPCAISMIDPMDIFFTSKAGGLKRSETAGADYDASNFTANLSVTYSGYRMPIALWESFTDETNPSYVWYYGKDGDKAGDVVQCFSENGDYPFNYTLTHNMTSHDSILVQDPVCSKIFVAMKEKLYFTREALKFNVAPTWWRLASYTGEPLCLTVSADGDAAFVGFADGNMLCVRNLMAAVDTATSCIDSADFAPIRTDITLPINGQCVTSIAINPNDANKVVVTLGNYGNDSYVLYSTNALSDNPTFTAKQGNLPKMPVYSSVIEMTTGKVFIGTEHGIYVTDNIAASNVVWTKEDTNMGDVPVMDLKQQVVFQEPQYVYTYTDEDTTVAVYGGANNQGTIYAATYGRGIFRCETYLQHQGASVVENNAVETNVSMYPNPVRNAATISFDLNAEAAVSYQVYDMMGRMVMTQTLGSYAEGSHAINVDMSELASGSYVLSVNAGGKVSNVKFMVF